MRRLVSDVVKGLSVAAAVLITLPSHAGGPFLSLGVPATALMGARTLCRNIPFACRNIDGKVNDHETLMLLADRTNREVNRNVIPTSDQELYGTEEHWAVAVFSGDCEDYALAKKEKLLKLGVGSDRLLMATVLDLDRNHHAVLILRTERGDYVLDNLIDEIKYWGDTGYIFLRIQLPLDKKQWRSVF